MPLGQLGCADWRGGVVAMKAEPQPDLAGALVLLGIPSERGVDSHSRSGYGPPRATLSRESLRYGSLIFTVAGGTGG